RLGDTKPAQQERQEPLVTQSKPVLSQIEPGENPFGGRNDFDFICSGGAADHVDITLIKLAIAPEVRAIGAPHGSDVITAKDFRELPLMGGHKACQRDGEVKPQPVVREILALLFRLGKLVASLQNLEQKFFIFASSFAEENLQIFHRGGVNGKVAIELIDRADRLHETLPQQR